MLRYLVATVDYAQQDNRSVRQHVIHIPRTCTWWLLTSARTASLRRYGLINLANKLTGAFSQSNSIAGSHHTKKNSNNKIKPKAQSKQKKTGTDAKFSAAFEAHQIAKLIT